MLDLATVRRKAQVQLDRIAADERFHAWIRVLTLAELEPYLARLATMDPAQHPLWGMTFAIKDNIDLAGIPTTAGCPAFARVPTVHATVVERLLAAGAIPLGKANMDQFATGLVGTRSPYGVVPNPFDERYLAGGSSSGSAAALALGHCDFALGTDTAGSGRVPAAFCGLVGVKPTRGLVSTRGVVPACRSLDCVSIFAPDLTLARNVLAIAEGFDSEDAWSRKCRHPTPTIHTLLLPEPSQLTWFGDGSWKQPWEQWRAQVSEQARAAGIQVLTQDIRLLLQTAELLYGGPWIAERWSALGSFVRSNPADIFPLTKGILESGSAIDGAATFSAFDELAGYRRKLEAILPTGVALALPTAGGHFRLADVEAEPLLRNRELGTYTNFCNLLDLAALAIPVGKTTHALPWGITLFADRHADHALLELAGRLGQAPTHVELAVVGAHLRGFPLHKELLGCAAEFVREARTTADYRFYALATTPPKPGLVACRRGEGGSIAVEVYRVPLQHYGRFVAGIPWPLGIGRLRLEDGTEVQGFTCEAIATEGAQDITAWGGWKAYRESL